MYILFVYTFFWVIKQSSLVIFIATPLPIKLSWLLPSNPCFSHTTATGCEEIFLVNWSEANGRNETSGEETVGIEQGTYNLATLVEATLKHYFFQTFIDNPQTKIRLVYITKIKNGRADGGFYIKEVGCCYFASYS